MNKLRVRWQEQEKILSWPAQNNLPGYARDTMLLISYSASTLLAGKTRCYFQHKWSEGGKIL